MREVVRIRTTVMIVLFMGLIPLALAQTYLDANGSKPEDTGGAARLLHYLPEDMPIEVFVPLPAVDNGEALRAQVVRALEAWQAAVPELVQFRILNAPAEGALTVTWREFEDQRVGSYLYAFSVGEDNVYRFRATDLLLDPRFGAEDTYRYALLEVGHTLGLLGRSPFEGDAMSTTPSGVISERDIATLRALYALPSGIVVNE